MLKMFIRISNCLTMAKKNNLTVKFISNKRS